MKKNIFCIMCIQIVKASAPTPLTNWRKNFLKIAYKDDKQHLDNNVGLCNEQPQFLIYSIDLPSGETISHNKNRKFFKFIPLLF